MDPDQVSFCEVAESRAQCSNLGLGVHLRSVLQQVSDYIGLASPGSHVKSRLPSLEDTDTHYLCKDTKFERKEKK